MQKARVLWPVIMCGVLVACGQGDREKSLETPPTLQGDRNLTPPTPIIVKGCLTSDSDRFVLTELDRGVQGPKVAAREGARPAAQSKATTESYRLIGFDRELRPLVGQRVEITGATEPEKVVEVREISPESKPKNQTTGTSGNRPRVSTVETTRLEISDLRVNSVQPTGEECGRSQH